jgi:hypothetical protein
MEATFGSDADTYLRLPADLPDLSRVNEYVRLLNDNLSHIRSVSKQFQDALVKERTAPNDAGVNEYVPGDFVLFMDDASVSRETKLSPRFKGPYLVILQRKNDVECKHLVQLTVHTFHVEKLKRFIGTQQEASDAALADQRQYLIDRIIAYAGDPMKRKTMQFLVRFLDGEELWLPYSPDLVNTEAYQDYIMQLKPLRVLQCSVHELTRRIAQFNRTPITDVRPGMEVYVDLRCYGWDWYDLLDLPDKHVLTYVVKYVYRDYVGANRTKIKAYCPIFDETFTVANHFVMTYGSDVVFDSATMILIDEALIARYPALLPSARVSTITPIFEL